MAARRRLADHQDRRRAAGLGAPALGASASSACWSRSWLVSIWTPLTTPASRSAGSPGPTCCCWRPCRSLTGVVAFVAWRALGGWGGDAAPFLAAMGLFLLSYLGIAISLWPMIVPGHFTLWQAASSEGTQAFLLVGTLLLLPVILMYTAWSYWVFRGKMRGDMGYH